MSLQTASQTYLSLRNVPGHFSDPQGEFNPDVDGYNGKKHVAMKVLAEHLKTGVPVSKVFQYAGKPDVLVPAPVFVLGQLDELENVDVLQFEKDYAPLMPGPVISGSVESESEKKSDAAFLVYFWRGKHDYLWFLVGGEKVLKNGWYLALE